MELFNCYKVLDNTAPVGVDGYRVITDVVTHDEVLKRMREHGNVYVTSHKGFTLYISEDRQHVYALSVEPDSKLKEISKSRESTNVDENFKFEKSKTFVSMILAFLMVFSHSTQSFALEGMTVDQKIYQALQGVEFRTSSGNISLDVDLTAVNTEAYSDIAFTFDDPRNLTEPVSIQDQGLPDKANKEMLEAILAYPKINSLDRVRQSTGINVTQEQLTEAVQLSIWKQAVLLQGAYQIIETSITDSSVRTLSTEIDTWASNQINNKPANTMILDMLLPQANPILDARNAQRTTNDTATMFGPYVIQSNPRITFDFELAEGIIVDSSGKHITQVKSGEAFYLVFSRSFSGSINISLNGFSEIYSILYSKSRVWLQKELQPLEIQFNISTEAGSNGTVNFTLKDELTKMPVEGVEIQLFNESSPVTTLTTDNVGRATYDLPVGTYIAKIKPPHGYLQPQDQEIIVQFIGDIKMINIPLNKSDGIVNFYAIDASTLGSAGYAEAYVFNGDEAIKRLALNEGRCSGISLPAGDYSVVIYKTTGKYSISDSVPFVVEEGKSINVNIQLIDNTPLTTLKLEDTKNKQHWKISVNKQGRLLFTLNTNGSVGLRLRSGEYQVVAETNDGSYRIQPFTFASSTKDSTVVIPVVKGEHKVSFTVVDTVEGKPIPSLVVGLFDQNHNLLQHGVLDKNGTVTFNDIVQYNVYYFNVISAPETVSGYSANGNRFLGDTRAFKIALYSVEEISEITSVDTIFRVPNLSFRGSYTYPQLQPHVNQEEGDL